MIDKPIFTGAATALITPTTPAGVDYDALAGETIKVGASPATPWAA